MNESFFAITPATIAAMIADMSQALAEGFDSEDTSAAEWDSLYVDMLNVYNVLNVIVGEEIDDMLMDAGADPDAVYATMGS